MEERIEGHGNAGDGGAIREDIRETPKVLKRGPWRPVGKYIGRDVWLDNGSRTTELQHRVVAAEKLGRELTSDEHAHHTNEVKTDNRPENLEVLTKAEHARRHFKTGRTMVALTCQGCGAVAWFGAPDAGIERLAADLGLVASLDSAGFIAKLTDEEGAS
jgi:hypothetical protein